MAFLLYISSYFEGYELLWHLPVPKVLSGDMVSDSLDQGSIFVEKIPIRLIAIPVEKDHLVAKTLLHRGVFSYKPGGYYFSQVYNIIARNVDWCKIERKARLKVGCVDILSFLLLPLS